MVYYRAKARDGRTLELPEEAGALGLRAGDEVNVGVDRSPSESSTGVNSTAEALAILSQIAEHHKDRRVTDNGSTQRLLEEARGGAAYGYEPAE